jgi:hypothetical protein
LSEPARKWLLAIVQALMSLSLVMLVLRQLDLGQAMAALRRGSLAWLAAALALYNLSQLASAQRFHAYLRQAAIPLSQADNLTLYYSAMFLNLFLPGGIGGDGYKVVMLARRAHASLRRLLAMTLADRAGGLLALFALLMLLGMLLAARATAWPAAPCAAAALAACALSLALHRRLFGMGTRAAAAILGLGLAVQLLQLACMAMLLAWLQVPGGQWSAFLALFLASSVAAALPLSIGGLGAREVTFLYGLQLLHLDPAPGVLASALFFLITALSALPGAWLLTRHAATQQRQVYKGWR